MVYQVSLSYLQNTSDAEDLTQEVFIQIFKSRKGFAEKSTIKTWIYRITINKCLDALKAGKRLKRSAIFKDLYSADGRLQVDVPHFDHPGIELEQKENAALLFHCIDRLPENQKTVILLSKTEGLSNIEIADIMELGVGAVESLKHRGLAAIKEKLGNYFDIGQRKNK